MIPEGAVLDWAALYLRQELGTDLATASFAFAAFSGVMAVMRFLGDGVRNRFGAVTTLRSLGSGRRQRACCVAGLSPWAWLAIAAFAFCGFGIANMVPIAFSAGGNQDGHVVRHRHERGHDHGLFRHSGGPVGDRLRRRAYRFRAGLCRAVGAAGRRLPHGRARSTAPISRTRCTRRS